MLWGTYAAVGPSISLEIVNKRISPDRFHRSAALAGGTFPGRLDVSPWLGSLQDNLPFDWVARYRTHGARSAQSADRLVVHMMAIPNGIKIPLQNTPAASFWSGDQELVKRDRAEGS
ncbi:hypothetical protein DFH09DRAFT_1354566 [Mycena vulgaris]|nr:hypothetical protein DFH09DRAFT_1354566 [Mycena vulgaris]